MATGQTEAERLAAVHDQRIKLRATYLSGLAIAVFAVGGFAPVIDISGPASRRRIMASSRDLVSDVC